MIRRPPRSTRTDTLFPYTTLFRSSTSAASYEAALLAVGAGLTAVASLEAGEGDSAFCAVRPPGHHATPTQAMGFCLFNNVAVTAAALAERGERVLIVDFDAHHGNGTQDAFWRDPRVAYVSRSEEPRVGKAWVSTCTTRWSPYH